MSDRIEGYLEVGLDESRREVIVNLPRDMTGHIKFSSDQARNLARLLDKNAWAIERDESQRQEAARREQAERDAIPVDRSAVTLTDGRPVSSDHRELKENGQQKNYVVLNSEERAKGFVRPFRRTYTHAGKLNEMKGGDGSTFSQRLGGCGCETTMSQAIAETYARDPKFYSGTFCVKCGKHLPLEEFVWAGTEEQVGS